MSAAGAKRPWGSVDLPPTGSNIHDDMLLEYRPMNRRARVYLTPDRYGDVCILGSQVMRVLLWCIECDDPHEHESKIFARSDTW